MSRRLSNKFMDGQLVFDNGEFKPLTHMKEYRKKQYAELERKLNDIRNKERYALITLSRRSYWLFKSCFM
ncbi:hypothetical protein Xmau_03009 [Xenorhabdus mauleonii]|uniref:Uncharacterized protein n=1 Tax=Xenorhabdus mauleonii TaxID=351675 RepID=A0A1I3SAL9_9GAMM|nr:hypothetical protein [Xenorhabdus mauleonii]PHM39104.1 hypothetical protein Xmau_03009 [Xenorhabdus mauleonii]SFJ55440.1 hypothetical protein SAMN05421680_11130 [Xenorhabdus mauleonii]